MPFYFATEKAILPLMETDSWLAGRRGIGLPFTDETEPLIESGESAGALFQHVVEFGKRRKWKYLECRGGVKSLGDVAPSLAFYGHHIELTADEDQMFENLHGSTRRAIRKAQKNGVKVNISRGLEAVMSFYVLQCKTRQRHGLPPQPLAFFQNIHKHVISQGLGIIATATYKDRAVAASVYFLLGKRAIYKFGASDQDFQSCRGNSIVMWEAIKWLVHHGATRLHLGKTALANDGLRRFKLHWGAVEEPLEYVRYDLRRDRFVTVRDGINGWHNYVFRAIPQAASRVVGRLLYKHWA
jgi:hypothetical protein